MPAIPPIVTEPSSTSGMVMVGDSMRIYRDHDFYHPSGHSHMGAYVSGGSMRHFAHEGSMVLHLSGDKATGECFVTAEIPMIQDTLGHDFGLPPKDAKRFFYQKLSDRLSNEMGGPPVQSRWVKDYKSRTYTLTWKLADMPGYPADGIDMRKMGKFWRDPEYDKISKLLHGKGHVLESVTASIRYEMANNLPAAKLLPTIDRVAGIFDPKGPKALMEFTPRYGDIAEYYRTNPAELEALEKTLAAHGIHNFKYMGHGRSGLFLQGADDTVVAIRGGMFGGVTRHPVPHHIQPLTEFRAGNFNIEILPKLDTRNVTMAHVHEVANAVAHYEAPGGRRYYVDDSALRNIGLGPDGTPYYLDGDGLHEVPPNKMSDFKAKHSTPVAQDRWLHEDGTWRQHEQFKTRHEQFGSPLHQAGGRINPEPLPMEPEIVRPKAVEQEVPVKPAEASAPKSEAAPAVEPTKPAATEKQAASTAKPEAAHSAEQPKATKPGATRAADEGATILKFERKAKAAEAEAANAEKTWNMFTEKFWKQEHGGGRKGIAIAGATVAVGAAIYGIKKLNEPSAPKPSWTERTQPQPSAEPFLG